MIHRSIRALAVLAVASLASAALAQQAAPAATPAAPLPKHSCAKPGDFPGNLASDTQKRSWQKEYVDYVDCLKKFIEDQQALADPHIKAANAAINEYNTGVKEYNAQIEKAKSN